MKITITIDGQVIEAEKGDVLYDVAADAGVYIPSLCYVRGKPCLGTCRACSVRVDGTVAASCTVRVRDGMEIEVNAPDLMEMRKMLVELNFAEGLHNCPSCEKSGRCDLQAVGYEVEMTHSRFRYMFPVREREYGSAWLALDKDRCIFCQRCVEFVRDEATGRKIFSISGRGTHASIQMDVELVNRMSREQALQASELCPVGCIIFKQRGYDEPIGWRKYDIKSIRQRVLEGEH